MPIFDRAAGALSTFNPFNAPANEPGAQDAAGTGANTPTHVSNATSPYPQEATTLNVVLTPRERAVHDAILETEAPERGALVWTMKKYIAAATTPEERDAITQRMEQALAARGRDVAMLRHLGINTLDCALTRAAWTTLMAELPGWASSAMTAGQLARSVFTGTWGSVAAVLPSLAVALPSLRTHEQFDALVQSLPETLRASLWTLHEQIAQADAQLRPNLGGGHLVSALAVAALLWQVQRSLPKPAGQLQGIGRFIAELPLHWQRIAVLNGVGGALLAPGAVAADGETDVPVERDQRALRPAPEEKAQRIEFQRWADRDLRPGPPRIRPTIDSLEPVTFEASRAPGAPQAGGPTREPAAALRPAGPADAAASPGSRQQAGWLAWLGAGIATLGHAARGGFQSVPQAAPAVEMTLMGGSALREVVTAPLMSPEAVEVATGAATTARMFPNLRRTPLALAAAATVTGAGAAVMGLKRYFWPDTAAATPIALAEQLAGEVVALPGGQWGTGLDLLLGDLDPDPAPRGARLRRAATNTAGALPVARDAPAEQLQGVSPDQLEALRADPALMQQAQTARVWSVAVARDLATQPGWAWVATLPASEQELLVSQWQALRTLTPALAEVEAATDATISAALQDVGWSGEWRDIEVRLPSVTVAGILVDNRLPLMQYCLTREGGNEHRSFLRNGVPVRDAEWAHLEQLVHRVDAPGLRALIKARVEQIRPDLSRALQARLVIAALKAKAHGELGSGDAHLRGADIVLGFLQGARTVERATLVYEDRINDTPVRVQLPDYLVLREPGPQGQVVLYRADLARFQAFDDQRAFRQFLDTRRARAGVFTADGAIDHTIADAIVAAAPRALRSELRTRVDGWEAGLARYQSGQGDAQAWNPTDSFKLAFAPVDSPEGARQQWADALVAHGESLAQEGLERDRLRWSPLGIANLAAEMAYRQQQDSALQSLRQHAHASVGEEMRLALRMAKFEGPLEEFDPDEVRLRVGGREMDLTDWATSGWQHHGLHPDALPANLPDWTPEAAGMPSTRLDPAPWLDDDAIAALEFTAYRRDAQGRVSVNAEVTRVLQDPALRRAICVELESFASSNRLADAYLAYLRALPRTAEGRSFAAALGDQIRARTGWTIEVARQEGALDSATHAALKAAHANLDPAGGRGSSLQGVTINGHAIIGLWAIHTPRGRHVFLPDTAYGDRLLDERAFGQWLRRPEAEDYILARAQLRHHEALGELFKHTATSRGIPVGFSATRGPIAAAAALIAARIADVDEKTVSPRERLVETLRVIGAISVGAMCGLATAGAGAAMCAAGSMAFVWASINDGVKLIDRGDLNGAILEFGGALLDAVDIAQMSAIPAMLFRLGRGAMRTPAEAARALVEWKAQGRAFDRSGVLTDALAVPRAALDEAPMLIREARGGGTLYRQNGRDYVQHDGAFVETWLDSNGVRRLRDPLDADAAGAPVRYQHGQWRRMEQRPTLRGTTSPAPNVDKPDWVKVVPEAEMLPPAKLDELEAVFGFLTLKQRPDTDLLQAVRELSMKARIQQIADAPYTLGLPGDEAVILRAWADTPALGNGRSVETYIEEVGEWTRGARFGTGPVGLFVRTDDARTLPTLDALVEAADEQALLARLGIDEDTSHVTLMAAVRQALGHTIAAAPAQSLQTWQRWAAIQHRLPAAADNLVKHYPALTRAEAEALVNSDRVLKQHAESWLFPQQTAAKVADVLGNRSRRQQREAVVSGRIRSLSEVQVLGSHLQDIVPGCDWSVAADTATDAAMLVFRRASQDGVAGQLAFSADGRAYIPAADGSGNRVQSWQEGIFAQLTAAERQQLSTPDGLRRAVVDHMKKTPLLRACTLPRALPGARVKRGLDTCDPPAGVTLTQEEVATRDAVNQQLYQLHERAEQEYAGIRALLAESEALKAEKRALQAQGQALPEAKLARVAELATMDLMHERNFRVKNFVTYALEDLRFDDAPLPLQDFPLQGGAYSGPPVAWMKGSGYVGTTPIRRVFVADDQVEKSYKGKGKQRTETPIPPHDRFRADYAMGADLMTASSERARSSGLVTLTDDDLRAQIGPVDADGHAGWVRLGDLDAAQIEALPRGALSEPMQKLLGDAQLLPSNVRDLMPGPYRVFEIRSCSEGKVIDSWFSAMTAAAPALATPLRAAVNTPERGLSGRMALVSDMHPCATSCDRRLTDLTGVLPNLQTRVYYHFTDNPERTEWRLGLMVERELQRTRAQWEAAGEEIDAVRAGIRGGLLDKANPARREAAEAELLRNPPGVTELPVPRLWLPAVAYDEGL
jgi:hypothetical protein